MNPGCSVCDRIKKESDLIANLNNPARNNPFGKTEAQRANFMNWQEHLLAEALQYEHMLIYGNDTQAAYNKIIKYLQ